jgi:hypothetical protein
MLVITYEEKDKDYPPDVVTFDPLVVTRATDQNVEVYEGKVAEGVFRLIMEGVDKGFGIVGTYEDMGETPDELIFRLRDELQEIQESIVASVGTNITTRDVRLEDGDLFSPAAVLQMRVNENRNPTIKMPWRSTTPERVINRFLQIIGYSLSFDAVRVICLLEIISGASWYSLELLNDESVRNLVDVHRA